MTISLDELTQKLSVYSEAWEATKTDLLAEGVVLIPMLIDCLRYGSQVMSHRAVDLLHEFGSAATPPLLDLFLKRIPLSWSIPAYLLKGYKDVRVVDPLLQFVRETREVDDYVVQAVQIIGALDAPHALPVMFDLLNDSATPIPLKEQTILALGQHKAKAAVDSIADYLQHPELCASAALALYRITDGQYFEAVNEMLLADSGQPDLKLAALLQIEAFNDRRFVPTLIKFLHILLKRPYREGFYDVRHKLLDLLGTFRDERAIDGLMEAVEDVSFNEKALEALAQIGGKRVVERLIEQLWTGFSWWDEHLTGQMALIKALVTLGKPAVEPLIEALSRPNPYFRENVAHTLCLIGDSRAVEPLLLALENDRTMWNRGGTAVHLGRFKDVRFVEPIIQGIRAGILGPISGVALADLVPGDRLIELLQDDTATVREAAIVALGYSGDTHAVQPLIDLLPSGQHRSWIIDSLYHLDNPLAVNALIEYGYRWNPHITRHFIIKHGDADTVNRLIEKLEHSPPHHDLIDTLAELAHQSAIVPLRRILEQTEDAGVKEDILRTLVTLGDEQAARPYFDLIYSTNHGRTQQVIIRNLRDSNIRGVAELFSEFMRNPPSSSDDFNYTVGTLVYGLPAMGKSGFELLMQGLTSRTAIVRYDAACAIAPIFDVDRVVDALIERLSDTAKGDKNRRVCDAAADKLEQIGTIKALNAVKTWRATSVYGRF